jgi:hypothetical protein
VARVLAREAALDTTHSALVRESALRISRRPAGTASAGTPGAAGAEADL